MEPSIFKELVDQYQTPHPLLGVDGQAFPMIPYSMKLDLIQNAEPFRGLTMDDFINAETRRVKQLLDAANERGDSQLATRVLNELYPLMVEDIQSGNQMAVAVYSPVVNQMRYIIGATQQPQPVIQEKTAEPEAPIAKDEGPANAEPEPPIAKDGGPVDAEPVQEPRQVEQEQPDVQESLPVSQEGKPAQTEPQGAPVATPRKKRTPASSIVLFILGIAFLLAFLLINALPFIGIGTYQELDLMGLIDIAIGCLVLALVCCVVAGIILWRSKAKR